jgi:hypothetical protein
MIVDSIILLGEHPADVFGVIGRPIVRHDQLKIIERLADYGRQRLLEEWLAIVDDQSEAHTRSRP